MVLNLFWLFDISTKIDKNFLLFCSSLLFSLFFSILSCANNKRLKLLSFKWSFISKFLILKSISYELALTYIIDKFNSSVQNKRKLSRSLPLIFLYGLNSIISKLFSLLLFLLLSAFLFISSLIFILIWLSLLLSLLSSSLLLFIFNSIFSSFYYFHYLYHYFHQFYI